MRDFGGTVERTPREVVRPASAREVAAVLKRRDADVPVVPRGCGHSTDGRSLTGGVSLDMRGLAAVHDVRGTRVRVEAGATWREVLEATLPRGLTPPVLTDHLDLTVGGTLSAGGVGGTSHVHGTQADARNTIELEVVTRDGEIVSCSPARHSALYDAVRGGRGAHGVITGATLRLVPAPHRVVSCRTLCRDAAELIGFQTRLRADHISGQAKPSRPEQPEQPEQPEGAEGAGHPEEPGWRYELKAVLYDGAGPPPGPDWTEVEVLPYLDFADRMRPDVEELIALGEWERPHPWAMAFLPGDRAAAFAESTLAAMGAAELGLSGVVLIKALAPPGPVLFGLLRTASPGSAGAAAMTGANLDFHSRARNVGGIPYPA